MQPHRWQPTRLPHPWDSPGKNTRVGCHFLLQCMKVKSESEVVQLCPTLCDPVDCSPPGSSVHGILQARILEWVAISFYKYDQNNRFPCVEEHGKATVSRFMEFGEKGYKEKGAAGTREQELEPHPSVKSRSWGSGFQTVVPFSWLWESGCMLPAHHGDQPMETATPWLSE